MPSPGNNGLMCEAWHWSGSRVMSCLFSGFSNSLFIKWEKIICFSPEWARKQFPVAGVGFWGNIPSQLRHDLVWLGGVRLSCWAPLVLFLREGAGITDNILLKQFFMTPSLMIKPAVFKIYPSPPKPKIVLPCPKAKISALKMQLNLWSLQNRKLS